MLFKNRESKAPTRQFLASEEIPLHWFGFFTSLLYVLDWEFGTINNSELE